MNKKNWLQSHTRNIWFVTGFEHSGTTILQSILSDQEGLKGVLREDNSQKYIESMPFPDHSNTVYKLPYGGGAYGTGIKEFLTALVTDIDPQIVSVAIIHRNPFQVICSSLKRNFPPERLVTPNPQSEKKMKEFITARVNLLDEFRELSVYFTNNYKGKVFNIDLENFASNPASVLNEMGFSNPIINGADCTHNPNDGSEESLPHHQLREWQRQRKPSPNIISKDFSFIDSLILNFIQDELTSKQLSFHV